MRSNKVQDSTLNPSLAGFVDAKGLDVFFFSVDGLVACPICGQRMEEMTVYSHLDRCEEDRKGRKALSPNHNTPSR